MILRNVIQNPVETDSNRIRWKSADSDQPGRPFRHLIESKLLLYNFQYQYLYNNKQFIHLLKLILNIQSHFLYPINIGRPISRERRQKMWQFGRPPLTHPSAPSFLGERLLVSTSLGCALTECLSAGTVRAQLWVKASYSVRSNSEEKRRAVKSRREDYYGLRLWVASVESNPNWLSVGAIAPQLRCSPVVR